jgi:hypothetical protein
MAKKIILRPVPHAARSAHQPPARSTDDILAEIRKLYFKTSAATIERDFDRAIDLLKSIPDVADRQRATVYREGISEMKKDWRGKKKK